MAHRAERTHTAIRFVGAALIQLDFAWGFVRTRKHAAQHHAIRTRRQGFGNVARKANAAVGNHRNATAFQGFGYVVHGRQLRHAHAGDNARRANRTRADAHFHRVCTRRRQIARRCRCGNVATDNLHFGEVLLHPSHAVNHTLAVAVRRIDHNHVHTSFHQSLHALFCVRARADRRTHAQTAFFVFVRIGKLGVFNDVFYRNQAFELVFLVQHQHALDFVFVHHFARFLNTGADRNGNQFFARRHDGGHGQIQTRFKTQIAVGHDADNLAVLHHRQPRHFAFALRTLRQQFANEFVGRHGHGVFHNAAFVAFHLAHCQSLLLGRHIFVDDADAAFLRHGNRQTRLGNRVHGSGQQRQVQCDFLGERSFERDIAGENLGMSRDEQNVVERIAFFDNTHFGDTFCWVSLKCTRL